LRNFEKARRESRKRLKKNGFSCHRDCSQPEESNSPGNILKTLERKEGEKPFGKDANRPPLRVDQRKSRAIASATIVAVLVAAALLPLAPPGFPGLPACVFKNATGLPCLLCGGTRATQALLRGDLSRAIYLNVAALPAVIAFLATASVLAWEALRGRRVGDWNAPLRRCRSMLSIMAALLCIYWLVHLMDALRGPKSELVDLRNPIARAIHKRFSGQTR
jgi:hypothetical protein